MRRKREVLGMVKATNREDSCSTHPMFIQQFDFGPISRSLSALLINPSRRCTGKDVHLFPEDSDPDLKLSVCNNRQTSDVIMTRFAAANSKDLNVSHSSSIQIWFFIRGCIIFYTFRIFVCLRKRQYFSIAEYLGTVENSDYARSQPVCLYVILLNTLGDIRWSFGSRSRWPRYMGNPKGDSTEGTYTILHFVRPLVVSPRIRIPSHAFNPPKTCNWLVVS